MFDAVRVFERRLGSWSLLSVLRFDGSRRVTFWMRDVLGDHRALGFLGRCRAVFPEGLECSSLVVLFFFLFLFPFSRVSPSSTFSVSSVLTSLAVRGFIVEIEIPLVSV